MLILVILSLTFCWTVVSDTVTLGNPRIIDYDAVRNVVFLNTGDSTEIILAGDKMLHQLKRNLSLRNNVSVCGNNSSNVMNKILLHSRSDKTIIVCGTQNGGICEKRSIENLSANPISTYSFSAEDDITSQAVITNDNGMLIGVVNTHKTSRGSNVTYKILRFDSNLKKVASEVHIKSEQPSYDAKPSVYYMAAEVDRAHSVFVINEKPPGGSKYRSKMVVVCGGGAHQTVDLQCNSNNKDYNLVQDGTFISLENVPWLSAGDRLFVGIFRSADAETDESGESGICVKKLSDMAISNCAGSGTSPVTMTPVYTWTSDRGYLTTVTGHMVPDTNTAVIQFGTSTGHFIQTSLHSFGDNLEPFADLLVQDGVPVVAIHTSDVSSGVTYVVTRNKITTYAPTNCTLYKTCKETMESKNPYCGWCVFDERSTTRSECTSGDWLSVFSPCVSLTLSRYGQEADTSATVIMTASRFTKIGNERFQCKIMGEVVQATINGFSFTCTIPPAKAHILTTLTLEAIKKNGEKYIVGSTQYWFYKCAKFKRCGECIETAGVQCQWCSAKCQDNCPSQSSRSRRSEVSCPKVIDSTPQFLPNAILKTVAFGVRMIPASETMFAFACSVTDSTYTKPFPGIFGENEVSCAIMLEIPENVSKRNFDVILQYGPPGSLVEIDGNNTVTVYRPEMLAKDCTHCKYLNKSRYQCNWNGTSCVYNAAGFSNTGICPAAALTQITPSDGNARGGTLVTIYGSDMVGSDSSSVLVSLGGSRCSDLRVLDVSKQPEFEHTIIDSIKCTSNRHMPPGNAIVDVSIGGKLVSSNTVFSYKEPRIQSISPNGGIRAGGVNVTFAGDDLASGNRKVSIKFNKAIRLLNCIVNSNSIITCVIQGIFTTSMYSIRVSFDGGIYSYYVRYDLLENPTITNISSVNSICSGGLIITIYGDNFENARNHRMTAYYNGIENTSECENRNSTNTEIRCRSPPAPPNLKTDLKDKLKQNRHQRRKRSATCPCIEVAMKVQLDGFEKEFIVSYYPDPTFDDMTDVRQLETDEEYITLTGSYLDFQASVDNYIVHIGEDLCTDVVLTDTRLTCKVPKHQPDGTKYIVTVTVGNVYVLLGYVQYGEVNAMEEILKIVGAGGAVLIAFIVCALVFGRYQLLKMRKMKLEWKRDVTEMEVRLTKRQEFAVLANSMLIVNKRLQTQGLPFHSYQQYAFNVLFSADQALINQAVQLGSQTKKAMDILENLILNKFFVVSLVTTMEKQKRFSQKERVNLSSNICVILMGEMEYLNSIVQVLLTELVKDAVARKQHKSLFRRRCETVTESLLYKWLALTLYPHFRSSSGSPLYLLYMAMQLTMESGPIDAITGDAKYTLLEDKLLRRWESTRPGDMGVQLKAKSLTLKMMVDNGDRVHDCTVLGCDTITQVKAKCLRQIYVNYPASQLGVDPADLLLNWRAGHKTLKDEDKTSHVEGNLLRYNTLDHCNIRDQANMTLHDPNSLDIGHYVSLDGVGLECQDREDHYDMPELLNSYEGDAKNQVELCRWHLVKPGNKDAASTEKDATDLNSLFTTKQSTQTYIAALFDHILDSAHCPPPAKCICDYMDTLANTNNIDEQTLNTWKSQSYVAGIWGNLIRKPSQLFDVVVPPYVEDSLGVISQWLDDCLAASSPKLTEDTPAYKRVFHKETTLYRDKVSVFYESIQMKGEQTEVLKEYLDDLSKEQNGFNKTAYLQKLYDQLGPYLEEIVDSLAKISEAKFLGLDEKMQEVINMMKK